MKKIAFATCVQLGLSCIEEIYRIGGKLDLLITLHDGKQADKTGRIYLDSIAEVKQIPLLKIDHINDPAVYAAIKEYEIDWLFIIGWSQIAHKQILDAPALGCIGMHPSLLPEGRGRAAIPWAILKGLKKTGVTMFKLDEGVDTGAIIGQGVIPLDKNTTAAVLYQKVKDMHIQLISGYWRDIAAHTVTMSKQDEAAATIWPGRKPADGEILSSMTMDEADRLIRAVTHPYPGAFYRDKGRLYRIWSAKTSPYSGMIQLADGYLEPVDYQTGG